MKLLKHKTCLWVLCGGNVKIQTTLVEGPGIGFWTRVRLPSSPLKNNPIAFAVGFFYLDNTYGIFVLNCIYLSPMINFLL